MKKATKYLKQLSNLNDLDEWNDKAIEQEESIIDNLEKSLQFKNQEEHQKWLDVLFSFKFWEDFEELTKKIIRRSKK